VGQEHIIEHVLISILTNQNALLESYPGLGKTLLIKSISEILDLDFKRIQNTPDLMPSDVIGTYIIDESRGKKQFVFQKGPVFANLVLADEINRATPKTQAALLEAMAEKQVTVGNEKFELEAPFFILATQNPIDQEGTYPLPEAQIDRFLLKIVLDYPNVKEEIEILNRFASNFKVPKLKPIIKKDSLLILQKLTRQVPISEDIKIRVAKIINKTRTNKELIAYGASPRATIGLILASKARALIHGRKFVSNDDVNEMALPVLRHRIILNFKAERSGLTIDDVIKKLL